MVRAERRAQLGVAVVGAGSIGTLRAHVLADNPAVGFLGICDIDAAKAKTLAEKTQADHWTTDIDELLGRDEVDAVVISTSEGDHFDPTWAAIGAEHPVFIEKPIVIDEGESRRLLAEADRRDVDLYVGFTQRFRRRYLSAKQTIENGTLGSLTSACATFWLGGTVAEAVMRRAGKTSPAMNTLTYSVDLLLWYLESQETRPATIYAQGSRGAIWDEYGVPDANYSILTFDDGTIVNFGVSWEQPKHHPAYVATMRYDLFGRNGSLSIDDTHRDVLLVCSPGVRSPYTPELEVNVAFTGSAMPGEWAPGGFTGPLRDETDAFIRTVTTGVPHPALATGRQGHDVLAVTKRMDEAATSGEVMKVQLDG